MTPRPLERECQSAIIDAARRLGYLVHAERPAIRQSGKWSTPVEGDVGFPDLCLVHNRQPVIVFAELKRRPNKTTPQQELWIDCLRDAGVGCHVVYVPEDMDRFIRDLARWARGEDVVPVGAVS